MWPWKLPQAENADHHLAADEERGSDTGTLPDGSTDAGVCNISNANSNGIISKDSDAEFELVQGMLEALMSDDAASTHHEAGHDDTYDHGNIDAGGHDNDEQPTHQTPLDALLDAAEQAAASCTWADSDDYDLIGSGRSGAMSNDVYSTLHGRGRGRSHALKNAAYAAWAARTGHNTLANSAYAWIEGGDADPQTTSSSFYMDVSPNPTGAETATASTTRGHRNNMVQIDASTVMNPTRSAADLPSESVHEYPGASSCTNVPTRHGGACIEDADPLYAVPLRFNSGVGVSSDSVVVPGAIDISNDGDNDDDSDDDDYGCHPVNTSSGDENAQSSYQGRTVSSPGHHYVSEEPLYIDSTILALMAMESDNDDDDDDGDGHGNSLDDTYE